MFALLFNNEWDIFQLYNVEKEKDIIMVYLVLFGIYY